MGVAALPQTRVPQLALMLELAPAVLTKSAYGSSERAGLTGHPPPRPGKALPGHGRKQEVGSPSKTHELNQFSQNHQCTRIRTLIMICLMKLKMLGAPTEALPKHHMKEIGPVDHGGHEKMIDAKMETFQNGTVSPQSDRFTSERSTCGGRLRA